jgi:hypothetical protein
MFIPYIRSLDLTVLLVSRSVMKLEFEWNDAKAEADL